MFKPKNKDELIELIKTVKDLNTIDTSLITDMCGVFSDLKSLNQLLTDWSIFNVRNMCFVANRS